MCGGSYHYSGSSCAARTRWPRFTPLAVRAFLGLVAGAGGGAAGAGGGAAGAGAGAGAGGGAAGAGGGAVGVAGAEAALFAARLARAFSKDAI